MLKFGRNFHPRKIWPSRASFLKNHRLTFRVPKMCFFFRQSVAKSAKKRKKYCSQSHISRIDNNIRISRRVWKICIFYVFESKKKFPTDWRPLEPKFHKSGQIYVILEIPRFGIQNSWIISRLDPKVKKTFFSSKT